MNFQLRLWQSVFGILRSLQEVDGFVTANISGMILRYPDDTQEAKILLTLVDHVGLEIGVLRVDTDPPLRINLISHLENEEPSPFLTWWNETYFPFR